MQQIQNSQKKLKENNEFERHIFLILNLTTKLHQSTLCSIGIYIINMSLKGNPYIIGQVIKDFLNFLFYIEW